jgi:hypothetical protein
VAFNRVKLYRLLVLDVDLNAPAVFSFWTELPAAGLNLVRQVTLQATAGRQPVKVLLPSTAKGRYAKAQLAPTGIARLYGVVLFGKRTGEPAPVEWEWRAGPVDPTPEDWQVIPLPIPPTSEEWTLEPLPIPPTGEEWQVVVSSQIPQTPDAWDAIALPIPPTGEEWQVLAAQIPVTPEAWETVPLPIPPTSEQWSELKLPIAPTADEYDWAEIPLDQ